MSGSPNVPGLPRFEQRLAAKRQMLAQKLANPGQPAFAQRRRAILDRVRVGVGNREKAVHGYLGAYTSHLRAVADLLAKPQAAASGGGAKRSAAPGGLGESA